MPYDKSNYYAKRMRDKPARKTPKDTTAMVNPPRPPPDPKSNISMVLVECEGIRVYHQS